MKKALLVYLLILCCSFTSIFAQTGAPDLTFGTEGRYSHEIDSLGRIFFGLQSDEKIIMTSSQIHTDSLGIRNELFTMRFLADGGIDSSYGINGQGDYMTIPEGDQYLYHMAVQEDDKILVGGEITVFSKPNFLICRFNADGTVDSGFAENGYKIIPITVGSSDHLTRIEVLPDGKILLIGKISSTHSMPALVRLNEDGSFDTIFGVDGIKVIDDIPYAALPWGAVIQEDGKIVMTLTITTSPFPFKALRLNPDGTRDMDFGVSGIVNVSLPTSTIVETINIQTDGKIVASGSTTIPGIAGRRKLTVFRLNVDGSKDVSFGIDGIANLEIGHSLTNYFINVQKTDNKILAIVRTQLTSTGREIIGTARLLTNGNLDTEWNDIGYRVDSFHESGINFPGNLFYTNDGKVLIIGYTFGSIGSYKTYIDMARFGSCQMEITAQPEDQETLLGSPVRFIVTGSSPSAVYQWQSRSDSSIWTNLNDDEYFSGVHNDTLTINSTQVGHDNLYFRAIGIAGACTDTSLPAQLDLLISIINEVNNPLSAYQLYPNPVSDILHIDGSKAKTVITSVEVSDISGKRIYQEQLNSTKKLSITTERWNAGIYLIRLNAGKNDAPHTFRIIKS